MAHPYRDPGPRLLPLDRPLERASPGARRGWLAVSLVAHVTIVLFVMRCAEIEQLEPTRHGSTLQPHGVAERVELRQPVRVAARRYMLSRVICGGVRHQDSDSTASAAQATPNSSSPMLSVAPNVLGSLLISGDTEIQPSAEIELLMRRAGVTRIDSAAKLCIGTDGAVTSVTLLRSTKYAEYDTTLVSALRRWRYRPYLRDGVAQAVCSAVAIHHSCL